VQLLKNFPTFYGMRRFITVFKRALQWPYPEPDQSYLSKIHFNIIHPTTCWASLKVGIWPSDNGKDFRRGRRDIHWARNQEEFPSKSELKREHVYGFFKSLLFHRGNSSIRNTSSDGFGFVTAARMKVLSSGIQRGAVRYKSTDVSEERTASICMVEDPSSQESSNKHSGFLPRLVFDAEKKGGDFLRNLQIINP
jgi:hypothetical protein